MVRISFFSISIFSISILFSTSWGFATDFDPLLEYMEQELAFEENNFDILDKSEKFATQRRTRESETYANFQKSIEKGREFLTRLKNYREDGKNPNRLLHALFMHRFSELKSASLDYFTNMENSLNNDCLTSACWTITTESVSSLEHIELLDAQWNQIISKTSLDRFQLYNALIKGLLLDMKEKSLRLTKENQTWLRCARTLHPMLLGKVELVEKPEQFAGANYEKDFDRSFDNELNLSLYYKHENVTVKFPDLMLGAPRNSVRSMTVTQHALSKLERSIRKTASSEAIPKPRLPKFSYPDDVHAFVANEPTEPKNDNKVVQSTGEIFLSSETSTEAEAVTLATGDQVLLRRDNVPKSEDILIELRDNPWEENTTESSSSTSKDQPDENDEIEKTQKNLLPRKRGVRLKSNTEHKPITYDAFTKEFYETQIKLEHEKFQELKQRRSNRNSNAIPNLQIDPLALKKEWLNQRLRTADIIWLRKLFDNYLGVVAYSDFARVWKRLCGEQSIVPSKKGSSHFKLLNSLGFVVGGIFTHGDGQEYWGSAITDLKRHFGKLDEDFEKLLN